MPTSKQSTELLAIYLPKTVVEDADTPGLATIELSIVKTEYSNGERQPAYSHVEKHLQNFKIYAQLEKSQKYTTYAWQAHYSGPMTLGIRDLEEKLKWMKKVDRVIKGFPVKPQSFGQFVQMLASGLKIKSVIRRSTPERLQKTGLEFDHPDFRYLESEIDRDIRDYFDRQEAA
jgi:hypothetical protein